MIRVANETLRNLKTVNWHYLLCDDKNGLPRLAFRMSAMPINYNIVIT